MNTNLGTNGDIVTAHSGSKFGRSDNYGQAMSPGGANGCTYPKNVPTMFNRYDAAGVTWKGYAQDLHNQTGREDGLGGAPGTAANNPTTNPKSMTPSTEDKANGTTSFTGAQANDQYVTKHFPFPWFHSIIGDNNTGDDALTTPANGGTDTNASHIANLDAPTYGLIADLKKPADGVPAFSWITPNNCSDAHGEPDYSTDSSRSWRCACAVLGRRQVVHRDRRVGHGPDPAGAREAGCWPGPSV